MKNEISMQSLPIHVNFVEDSDIYQQLFKYEFNLEIKMDDRMFFYTRNYLVRNVISRYIRISNYSSQFQFVALNFLLPLVNPFL